MRKCLVLIAIACFMQATLCTGAVTRIAFTTDQSLGTPPYCNTDMLTKFVNAALALNPRPQAILDGGDMINAANEDGFDCFSVFTNVMTGFVTNGIPYYCAVGNHDPYLDTTGWYAKWTNAFYFLPTNGPPQWSQLAYYVDVGSCRMVFLDCITAGTNSNGSDVNKVDPVERTWLQSIIGPNSPQEFDVVVLTNHRI